MGVTESRVEETEVKGGTTTRLGRVEGDLRVGPRARILAEAGGRVVVTGKALFGGQVTIGCDFECQSMEVGGRGFGPSGNVEVRGDLVVHGRADVAAHLEVEGEARAEELEVVGHLKSGSIL